MNSYSMEIYFGDPYDAQRYALIKNTKNQGNMVEVSWQGNEDQKENFILDAEHIGSYDYHYLYQTDNTGERIKQLEGEQRMTDPINIEEIRKLAGMPPADNGVCADNDVNIDGNGSPFSDADPFQDIIVAVITDPEVLQQLQGKEVPGKVISPNEYEIPNREAFESFMQENGFLEETYDFNNGYHSQLDHAEMGDYGDDFHPQGETSTPQKKLGPSAAKHGNNPMYAKQFTEEAENVHKTLVYEYRNFKKQFLEEGNMKHVYKNIIRKAVVNVKPEHDENDIEDIVDMVFVEYRTTYPWLDYGDLLFDVKARLAKLES